MKMVEGKMNSYEDGRGKMNSYEDGRGKKNHFSAKNESF